MKALGIITATTIAMGISWIWVGYVLSVLWGWFIVTTFSLTAISIPQAMGLMLVVKLLGPKSAEDYDEDDDFTTKLGKAFGRSVLVPALALAVGAVIRLWM